MNGVWIEPLTAQLCDEANEPPKETSAETKARIVKLFVSRACG